MDDNNNNNLQYNFDSFSKNHTLKHVFNFIDCNTSYIKNKKLN